MNVYICYEHRAYLSLWSCTSRDTNQVLFVLFMHNECIIFLLIYFYSILAYPVLATSTYGLFSVINFFLPYYISQSAENISIFVYQLSIFVNLTLTMLTNLNELIHDHFYQECGNFFWKSFAWRPVFGILYYIVLIGYKFHDNQV